MQMIGLVNAKRRLPDLVKRASGGERASDWRLAADFYRRATAEFQIHHPSTEPYLSEVRQAEADLGECERALKAPIH